MSSKLPISVFIITKNEEDRVARAIKSVIDWVDEVLVIDSGSTDNTVELAKTLGAKTSFHEWHGYGIQKRHGESLCKNDWIFNVDADEEVLPSLRDAITQLFKENRFPHAAYRVKRIIVPPTRKGYFTFGPGDHFVIL